MTTQTDIHPQDFINQLFELDEIAAVRIANIWGADSTNMNQYRAACSVVERQTVFPTCEHCEWPVVNIDEHANCEQDIAEAMGSMFDCDNCEDAGCARCDPRFDDDVDDSVSPGEVYQRALRHFGGNTELASEAASLYPGDFM